MPYEIVIHCRAVKEEIVSPETYSTAEEAATDLELLHVAIEAGDGVVKLPWFGGTAANITCAHVRNTDSSRGSNTPIEELIERLAHTLGFSARGDESDPPDGESATGPGTGQSGPTPTA